MLHSLFSFKDRINCTKMSLFLVVQAMRMTACFVVTGLLFSGTGAFANPPNRQVVTVPSHAISGNQLVLPDVKPCVGGACDFARICKTKLMQIEQEYTALQTTMKQTQSCLQVPQLVTTKLSALQSAVADWNQSCRTLPSSANNPFGMASPNTLVDQASGQAHQIASICAQGSNCAATLKQFVSHIENDVNPLLKNGCDDPTYYGSKFKLQTQLLQNEAQNACAAPFASMQWGAMNIADTIQFYGASSVSLDTLCQVSWQTRCPDKRVISWTRTKSAPPWGNKTKTFNFHFRYCYENPDVTICDNMSPTGVSVKISHFTDLSAILDNKNLTIDINVCCLHNQCDAMADSMKASLPNDH